MAAKRRAPAPAPKTSIGEYARAGFGLGLGTFAVFMLLMVVALAFFIPGFIIVARQQKKPKEERSTGMLVLGYILMVIGMIVGLGFGAGAFFDLLSADL